MRRGRHRPEWTARGFGRALPLVLALLYGCGQGAEESAPRTVPPEAGTSNEAALPPLPGLESAVASRNPQRCVDAEAAAGFTFKDQVSVREAQGFSVRYAGNVKHVTVRQGGRVMRYVLVQCGTPLPADLESATVIEVPIERFVTTSTTELPAVVMLDAAGGWIGHGSLRYVSGASLRQRITDGAVFEAGAEGGLDVERVIAADPDVVFADTYGDAELGVGGQLDPVRAAGIGVVAVPSYLERSPLGRAEWLVFMALFLNREAEAADLFDQVRSRYQSLAALGRQHAKEDPPLAITGAPVGEVWHVPAGGSYMAIMLADAGIDTPWSGDPRVGSLALAFEAVWHRGREADWWIQPSRWRSREEILAADARLADLPALAEGNVVISDRRLVPGGGNDFWEAGHARPDLVLADLIHLVHPDRLPDHELVFLRRLGTNAGDTP